MELMCINHLWGNWPMGAANPEVATRFLQGERQGNVSIGLHMLHRRPLGQFVDPASHTHPSPQGLPSPPRHPFLVSPHRIVFKNLRESVKLGLRISRAEVFRAESQARQPRAMKIEWESMRMEGGVCCTHYAH